MSQFRRRVALAGAAALALATSVGAAGATADHTAPPSYISSWLALSTGAANSVVLVDAVTRSTTTQTLTAGKACQLNSSGASVLAFSSDPASPGVGLSAGSIGVREKRNAAGTSCAAVDAVTSETLTLDLGTAVGELVASSASLDIDLKQSAQIQATAMLAGDPVGHFELRSGSSIVDFIDLPGTPDAVQECNTPADSGPDSGTNNNCRWNISGPSWVGGEDGLVFDRLDLKAIVGSFSLMGGADGPVAPLPDYFGDSQDDSVFELVEGTLDCDETTTLRGTIASSWTRLANLGTTSCTAYPFSTRTGTEDGEQFAEFTKPVDFESTAQALWTTTFVVGSGNTIPPVTIELDLPGGGTTGEFILEPCPSDWYDATTGDFDSTLAAPETTPYACLVSAVKGKGSLNKSATYVAYVFGDAKLRF